MKRFDPWRLSGTRDLADATRGQMSALSSNPGIGFGKGSLNEQEIRPTHEINDHLSIWRGCRPASVT
jgi:hypothetical protein